MLPTRPSKTPSTTRKDLSFHQKKISELFPSRHWQQAPRLSPIKRVVLSISSIKKVVFCLTLKLSMRLLMRSSTSRKKHFFPELYDAKQSVSIKAYLFTKCETLLRKTSIKFIQPSRFLLSSVVDQHRYHARQRYNMPVIAVRH